MALAAGWHVLPGAFTSSPAVRHQASHLWWFLVAMQPAAGVLFALDGVLLGAGDVAFMRTLTLAAALGVFVPLTVAAYLDGWGIAGVWGGLSGFVLARLVGVLARVAGTRWALPGT
ncbi:hypothetical protein [Acidiferrimicrobium sp. IK]|uniref:hypothetical protein n=1 Tax=Acidiferrimicrobium sp. IK TaxID=2871700 RepID=UPI0021CB320D|nr:hypothetical protein [Acidiferrimicrobium sp. IK]